MVEPKTYNLILRYCPGCLAPVDLTQDHCPGCERSRPLAGWPEDPYIGRLIKSKYRLEARLGAGGSGVVYLANQLHDDIELGAVVLKLLHRKLAANRAALAQLINETAATRKLTNPHVVNVFDMDVDEVGVPFIVREYIEGESLLDLLRRGGAIPPQRLLPIAIQIARALDRCHRSGIIHHDLKPSNVLLVACGRQDFVKVIDFGPRVDRSQPFFFGTPMYMAPEQIVIGHIDHRADIFALGVLLHLCLTGRPPIQNEDPGYLRLNLEAPPDPLRSVRPDLPQRLEQLLLAMMAKSPDDRPESMSAVETELTSIGVASGWMPGEDAWPDEVTDDQILDVAGVDDLFTRCVMSTRQGTPPPRGHAWLALTALASVGVGILLAWWLLMDRHRGAPRPPAKPAVHARVRCEPAPTAPRRLVEPAPPATRPAHEHEQASAVPAEPETRAPRAGADSGGETNGLPRAARAVAAGARSTKPRVTARPARTGPRRPPPRPASDGDGGPERDPAWTRLPAAPPDVPLDEPGSSLDWGRPKGGL